MAAAQPPKSTLRARRVAAELGRMRGERGLTLEDVAEQTGLSSTTISRIENRDVSPRSVNVRALLNAYGVDATLAEQVLSWTKDASEKGWWVSVDKKVMTAPYRDLTALEQDASRKLSFEPLVIPGLLQTVA